MCSFNAQPLWSLFRRDDEQMTPWSVSSKTTPVWPEPTISTLPRCLLLIKYDKADGLASNHQVNCQITLKPGDKTSTWGQTNSSDKS